MRLSRISWFVLSAAVLVGVLAPRPASAVPVSISATLTGDPRPENPDGLNVIVSILFDGNMSWWNVDLAMDSTHPNARLDEFGFDLVGPASQYTISGLSLPYSSATNDKLQGSGNASFLFTLDDPAGNANDATNVRSLAFTVTKTSNFVLNDFLNATPSCSRDLILGCSQLGAHLVALNAGSGQTDSGVALGNYNNRVPEPASLTLLGTGLLGLFAYRRRSPAARS